MKNYKDLSFENVKVEYYHDDKFKVYVIGKDGEALAEAKCEKLRMKDFVSDYFYPALLETEINYFFNELFNSEERSLTNNMPLDKYVNYVNDKYGEDEASTLNELYNKYCNLRDYVFSGLLNQYSECILIDTIEANFEKTGAGTLIVDYLKDNCSFIFLYGTAEAESYWSNKANFKEILNGHMYWSDNEKLNAIL